MAPQGLMLSVLALLLAVSFNISTASTSGGKKRSETGPKQPNPREPLVALRKFEVQIYNELQMYLLDSHCCSEDDDLGMHIIYPGDQQSWSFTGNWLGTTNFHCKLWWENGHIEFDAFSDNLQFVTDFCGTSSCVWTARQDGIYLTDSNDVLVFINHWEMIGR